MTGEVIKQFLVGLGFGVDDNSLKKFNKAIDNAYTRVALIAGAIKTAAAGTFLGIAKISQGFEEMGYQYRIIAPAINKAIILRKALMSAYKDAGINMVDAVQKSVKFNLSLEKTKYQLEGIVKATAVKFLPMLTKQMDVFRAKVSANMPKILAAMEKFVKFIFKASEGVTILATRLFSMLGRVWELLVKLDEATGGWSTKILAIVAAWKLLNLAFITTPIGMILTGLLALLALYDDFMTWKEGGDSLFDWEKWLPAIKAFQDTLGTIWDIIKGVYDVFSKLGEAIAQLIFGGDGKGVFDHLIEGGEKLLSVFGKVFDLVGNVTDLGGGLLNGISEGVGGLFGDSKPLGSNGGNATTQSVNQTTQIVVQGASNPDATAKVIAGEQNRVNFNMTRNMKGAAR